jgi:hypothetical protein
MPVQDDSTQDHPRGILANTFPHIERSEAFTECQEKKRSDFYDAINEF